MKTLRTRKPRVAFSSSSASLLLVLLGEQEPCVREAEQERSSVVVNDEEGALHGVQDQKV